MSNASLCSSGGGCLGSAIDLLSRFESEEDATKARPYLELGCRLGDDAACLLYATLLQSRVYSPGGHFALEWGTALSILAEACDLRGGSETCRWAAWELQGRTGWEKYLERACQSTETSSSGGREAKWMACMESTHLLPPTDRFAALETMCDTDDIAAANPYACGQLELRYASLGTTPDTRKRKYYAEREREVAAEMCRAHRACYRASVLALEGDVSNTSLVFVEPACKERVDSACGGYGAILQKDGRGKEAAPALRADCAYGGPKGCAAFARVAVSKDAPDGVSAAHALVAAHRACLLEDLQCSAVAEVLAAIPGDHAEEIDEANARACEGGYEPACRPGSSGPQ